jgi:hypothetical protein
MIVHIGGATYGTLTKKATQGPGQRTNSTMNVNPPPALPRQSSISRATTTTNTTAANNRKNSISNVPSTTNNGQENNAPNMTRGHAPAVTRAASQAHHEKTSPIAVNNQTTTTNTTGGETVLPRAPPTIQTTSPNASFQRGVSSTTTTGLNITTQEDLLRQMEEQKKAYTELRNDMEGLEKERDFYFEKLRDIEILLQDIEDKGQGNELTASIFKILYATAEGFEVAATADSPVPNNTISTQQKPPHQQQQVKYADEDVAVSGSGSGQDPVDDLDIPGAELVNEEIDETY